MNIKTLSIFTLLIVFAVNIFAQNKGEIQSPVTFSYEVGYANQLRNGKEVAKINLDGLRMGAFFKYNFTRHFFGQTGLFYEYLNYNTTQRYPSAASYRQSTSANQLNLPILVGYEIPLFAQIGFFAYGGPTLRMGLSESLLTATTFPADSTAKANLIELLRSEGLYRTDGFSNMYKDKQLTRFSILLSIGGGLKWKQFYLKSGYDFGLTNINTVDSSINIGTNKKRITQGGWFISLGYNF
ncbi:MAG: PorT family protein [Paludibacter sp.]|nr:PorT family protein [Paludibacter sp.]